MSKPPWRLGWVCQINVSMFPNAARSGAASLWSPVFPGAGRVGGCSRCSGPYCGVLGSGGQGGAPFLSSAVPIDKNSQSINLSREWKSSIMRFTEQIPGQFVPPRSNVRPTGSGSFHRRLFPGDFRYFTRRGGRPSWKRWSKFLALWQITCA